MAIETQEINTTAAVYPEVAQLAIVKIECDDCGTDLTDGKQFQVHCRPCVLSADEEKKINAPTLDFAACRRCDQVHYLNDNGYCSPNCERGIR